MNDIPQKWKNVATLEDAKGLIDFGMILTMRDAKTLQAKLSPEQAVDFVKHLANRIAEKHETRLVDEILVESLLVWLIATSEERVVQNFLESILSQPNRTECCLKLVEVALTGEISYDDEDETLFSMAVTLICELGLAIKDLHARYAQEFTDATTILSQIATYLLSVSNSNNGCIRLSLLNYFALSESGNPNKIGFNKIMGRFGHTVLDHLFHLLFKKKTEAVALQYLLENLPFVLEGDRHTQRIVHETWKFYMLKKPERFGLFLKTFTGHFQAMPEGVTRLSKLMFFHHLAALLNVVSEINHKPLTQLLLSCLAKFPDDREKELVMDELVNAGTLRKSIKDLVTEMRRNADTSKVIESAARFTHAKRGRKPSFARVQGWVTMNQINFLGTQPPAIKVS